MSLSHASKAVSVEETPVIDGLRDIFVTMISARLTDAFAGELHG